MKTSLLFFFALMAISALAQVQKQFIQPQQTGYTQAVSVAGGKTIYISGQVAPDATTSAKGDLRKQTQQVYERLTALLKEAGATFDDVVKITIYVVNYKPDDLPVIREVRSKFHNMKNPPASTLVGVQSLFQPEAMIEIEAVAVVK